MLVSNQEKRLLTMIPGGTSALRVVPGSVFLRSWASLLQETDSKLETTHLWSSGQTHGCCWEAFYTFAYCGLVEYPH